PTSRGLLAARSGHGGPDRPPSSRRRGPALRVAAALAAAAAVAPALDRQSVAADATALAVVEDRRLGRALDPELAGIHAAVVVGAEPVEVVLLLAAAESPGYAVRHLDPRAVGARGEAAAPVRSLEDRAPHLVRHPPRPLRARDRHPPLARLPATGVAVVEVVVEGDLERPVARDVLAFLLRRELAHAFELLAVRRRHLERDRPHGPAVVADLLDPSVDEIPEFASGHRLGRLVKRLDRLLGCPVRHALARARGARRGVGSSGRLGCDEILVLDRPAEDPGSVNRNLPLLHLVRDLRNLLDRVGEVGDL